MKQRADVFIKSTWLSRPLQGELELTDLNRMYLERGDQNEQHMRRDQALLGVGIHGQMLGARHFIHSTANCQGLKMACPEEIVLHEDWIDDTQNGAAPGKSQPWPVPVAFADRKGFFDASYPNRHCRCVAAQAQSL